MKKRYILIILLLITMIYGFYTYNNYQKNNYYHNKNYISYDENTYNDERSLGDINHCTSWSYTNCEQRYNALLDVYVTGTPSDSNGTRTCRYSDGYTQTSSGTCTRCANGYKLSGGKCVCNAGYNQYCASASSSPTTCVNGSSPNGNRTGCVCDDSNEEWTSSNRCVAKSCTGNNYSSTGKAPCNACPQNAVAKGDHKGCICNETGKEWKSSTNTCGNMCSSNYFYKSGKCEACPIGQYSSSATACSPCSTGYTSSAAGKGCDKCLDGYSMTAGRCVKIDKCDAGKGKTDSMGSGSCTTCNKGTYSPAADNNCYSCPIGYTTNGTGKTSESDCNICEDGYYKSGSSCKPCSELSGQFYCSGTEKKTCSTGKIPNEKRNGCVQRCDNGEEPDGNGGCQECSKGFGSKGGTSKCSQCPAGTYNGIDGGNCDQCPDDKYSVTGAQSCQPCKNLTGKDYCNSSHQKATCGNNQIANSTRTGCLNVSPCCIDGKTETNAYACTQAINGNGNAKVGECGKDVEKIAVLSCTQYGYECTYCTVIDAKLSTSINNAGRYYVYARANGESRFKDGKKDSSCYIDALPIEATGGTSQIKVAYNSPLSAAVSYSEEVASVSGSTGPVTCTAAGKSVGCKLGNTKECGTVNASVTLKNNSKASISIEYRGKWSGPSSGNYCFKTPQPGTENNTTSNVAYTGQYVDENKPDRYCYHEKWTRCGANGPSPEPSVDPQNDPMCFRKKDGSMYWATNKKSSDDYAIPYLTEDECVDENACVENKFNNKINIDYNCKNDVSTEDVKSKESCSLDATTYYEFECTESYAVDYNPGLEDTVLRVMMGKNNLVNGIDYLVGLKTTKICKGSFNDAIYTAEYNRLSKNINDAKNEKNEREEAFNSNQLDILKRNVTRYNEIYNNYSNDFNANLSNTGIQGTVKLGYFKEGKSELQYDTIKLDIEPKDKKVTFGENNEKNLLGDVSVHEFTATIVETYEFSPPQVYLNNIGEVVKTVYNNQSDEGNDKYINGGHRIYLDKARVGSNYTIDTEITGLGIKKDSSIRNKNCKFDVVESKSSEAYRIINTKNPFINDDRLNNLNNNWKNIVFDFTNVIDSKEGALYTFDLSREDISNIKADNHSNREAYLGTCNEKSHSNVMSRICGIIKETK